MYLHLSRHLSQLCISFESALVICLIYLCTNPSFAFICPRNLCFILPQMNFANKLCGALQKLWHEVFIKGFLILMPIRLCRRKFAKQNLTSFFAIDFPSLILFSNIHPFSPLSYEEKEEEGWGLMKSGTAPITGGMLSTWDRPRGLGGAELFPRASHAPRHAPSQVV